MPEGDVISFKWNAGAGAGTMPSYDDGSTPSLVTEKPPAVVLKVRGGADTYTKRDGSIGTAGKGALTSEEVSFTVAATQDQTLFDPSFGIQDDHTPKFGEEVMPTLRRGGDGGTHQHVAQPVAIQGDGGRSSGGQNGCGVSEDGASYTLNTTDRHSVSDGYVVRRLTPEECERLQGMPTGHTRIPWKGKPAEECPDGPRYKAIGNSMAVPVMRWIGERIAMVDRAIGD